MLTGLRARLRDLPARSALRLCNQPLARSALDRQHRKSLAAHRKQLPALQGIDAEVVAGLRAHGVYITTLDALGLAASEAIVRDGGELGDRFADEARARVSGGETFVYVPPEWIVERPAIFDWGLQDRLLDIAEAYIGLPPAYDGVCINYTVADGREVSTRKWHRDWEDRTVLKVAVYVHDVDGNGGPFEMIRRVVPQSDTGRFNYDLADEAELARRLGPDYVEDVVSCVGPRGTVVFTDTARFFHRGKPATERDRVAIFYSYFASRPRHPFLCERTGMARRDILRLARMLPDRQRAAALWRNRLPAALRLIPPAKL